MIHVDKARSSFRFRLLWFIWVWSGNLSRWAGRMMITMLRTAERKDYP